MLTKSLRPSDTLQPVGKYVSVLLEMGKVNSPGYYSQEEISELIRENQDEFDSVYHDEQRLNQTFGNYANQIKEIFIVCREFSPER